MLLANIEVLNFDANAANYYGRIRAHPAKSTSCKEDRVLSLKYGKEP